MALGIARKEKKQDCGRRLGLQVVVQFERSLPRVGMTDAIVIIGGSVRLKIKVKFCLPPFLFL